MAHVSRQFEVNASRLSPSMRLMRPAEASTPRSFIETQRTGYSKSRRRAPGTRHSARGRRPSRRSPNVAGASPRHRNMNRNVCSGRSPAVRQSHFEQAVPARFRRTLTQGYKFPTRRGAPLRSQAGRERGGVRLSLEPGSCDKRQLHHRHRDGARRDWRRQPVLPDFRAGSAGQLRRPLLDENGNLIGVVSSKLKLSERDQERWRYPAEREFRHQGLGRRQLPSGQRHQVPDRRGDAGDERARPGRPGQALSAYIECRSGRLLSLAADRRRPGTPAVLRAAPASARHARGPAARSAACTSDWRKRLPGYRPC